MGKSGTTLALIIAIPALIAAAIITFQLIAETPDIPLPRDDRATPVVTYLATPTPLSFVPIAEPTKPYYVTAYIYGYLSPCGVYKPSVPGKEYGVQLGARYYAPVPCFGRLR